MDESKETIRVNVNVEITPVTLEAIVENAKLIAGKDERGRNNSIGSMFKFFH
jgi:hypothetical protein